MAEKAETTKRIVDTALNLAAEQGWRDTSLNDIADAAGVSLSDLHRHYGSRVAILAAYIERIDGILLAGAKADLEDTPRDRLFDVLMRRFDALGPHKAGVRAVARDLSRDPLSLACLLPCFARSMAWTLEAAGIGSGGLRGRLRARGLGLVYLSALRAWFEDETDDLAKTMAALNRALDRADSAVKSAPFGCLGGSEKEAAPVG
jgi:AcrR family transcriptional regulator